MIKHDNAHPHNSPVKHTRRMRAIQPSQAAKSISPIRFNDTYRSSFDIGHPSLCIDNRKPGLTPVNQELAKSQLLTTLNFDNYTDRQKYKPSPKRALAAVLGTRSKSYCELTMMD